MEAPETKDLKYVCRTLHALFPMHKALVGWNWEEDCLEIHFSKDMPFDLQFLTSFLNSANSIRNYPNYNVIKDL